MRDARFCAMAASPLGVINTRWFDARSFATALTFVFLCSFLDRLILRAWCGAFFLVKLKEAMEAAKDRDYDAGVLANWRQTMSRTAAHATEYVRVRPGTHIPTIYGMLWHIFKNGWEDKEFIRQRVFGMDDIRKEVDKWPPDEVERVTGLPEAQVRRVAEMFAKQRPSTLIWAMGQTQFTVGTANVRASCILTLATGNVGRSGTGANIFRGHTNVQGATDLGLDVTTLPLYYGLGQNAWKHWCRVWDVDYDWMVGRFSTKALMEAPGIPSTRWFDATLLPKDMRA